MAEPTNLDDLITLYHGSPTAGIEELEPRMDPRLGLKGVFASDEPTTPMLFSLLNDRSKSIVRALGQQGGEVTPADGKLNDEGWLYEMQVPRSQVVERRPHRFHVTTKVKPTKVTRVTREDVEKAGWKVKQAALDPHTRTQPDGRMLNVHRLFDLVKGRTPSKVSLADLSPSRSERSGFNPDKLRDADTSFPIMLDPDRNIVDGRHRVLKMMGAGQTDGHAHHLSEDDLASAMVDGDLVSRFKKAIEAAHPDKTSEEIQKFMATLNPEEQAMLYPNVKQATVVSAGGGIPQSEILKYAGALDALEPGYTTRPPDPAPIDPTKTGPDAIYRALQNLDLDKIEAESKDIVRRKLKSKRPGAVEKLGFIQGLRKTGILPHELMISRVPVIPPMYRPHSVAGDTFVPGDANELYRDLINLRGVHQDISERLAGRPVEESTLRLYDAVRSVYGFQDPVVPKTAERGVTGFLKQVTGTSPKFCHDDETEVMTTNDWVKFADLDPLNLPAVWTINQTTNYPQLQLPCANYVYAVDATMIRGQGPGVDFLVTDEHRMWVCGPMNDWMFITARELLVRDFEPLLMMRTSASDVVTLEKHMLSRVPYTGKVYCLTVENGTLVTRRNGVPLVSGNSFVQRKMLSRDSDFTGRGVATLHPDMGMDEIGLPEDMAWKIYGPHVQRRLVRGGLHPEEATRHLRERSVIAERHLDQEMAERPVIYSRAPAWHKFNILGARPHRVKGSSIVVSPFVTTGSNMDFDGDAINIHVPSTADAVKDTYSKLMPSKMLYSIKDRDVVVPQPKHEYLLGIHGAQTKPARNKHVFASRNEALAAAKAGKISLSDEVEFPS